MRRTVCGAICVVLALVLSMGTAGSARPELSSGAGSEGTGSGRTQAALLRVGPSRGSLSLSPQVGLVLTDFLNTRGRGDVRTTDYAALDDSIPDEVKDAAPTVKVESTDENSEAGTTTTVGTPADAPVSVAGAELFAAAGPSPYGEGRFITAETDIGVGMLRGNEVSGFSGFVDGGVREARARVSIGRVELAGGAVVLEGLEWNVVNRSGAATDESATFTLGGATILGQSFAPEAGAEDPLEDLVAALAPVLGPVGLELTFPVARIERGVVELSPLRIRVADSEAGTVLAPVLEGIQPIRDPLFGAIREGSEDTDAAILLTDVALGVLAGGSSLDIELGGASASTAPPAERFTFGASEFSPSPPLPPAPSSPITSTRPAPAAPTSDDALISVVGTPEPDNEQAPSEIAAPQPVASTEASRGGPLLAVAAAGLLMLGATAGRDYFRIRNGLRYVKTS